MPILKSEVPIGGLSVLPPSAWECGVVRMPAPMPSLQPQPLEAPQATVKQKPEPLGDVVEVLVFASHLEEQSLCRSHLCS